MPLETKTFTQIVSDQVTTIQGKVSNFQFPVGSLNLAIVESNAGVGLWLQGINIQLLAITRASSSTGSDLDTWMADFGFFRNQAKPASGLVTVSRFNTTTSAVIQVGALVQTSIGGIQFAVYEDDNNPNWNASSNGYVIGIGVSSINIPVDCTISGTIGNVIAGAINQVSGFLPIDSVTNLEGFTNGVNTETDNSFRARFIAYINSLSLGTLLAYQTAILNGTPQVVYNIAENVNISDATQLGFVTVIIDDGSGNPPASLINLISNKINAVRGLSIQYGVYPVVVLTANIQVTITLDPLASIPGVTQLVSTAISNYLSTLQIAQTVIYTKLYQIIYEASTDILEVSGLLINSATSDLVPSFKQRAYLGTLTIST